MHSTVCVTEAARLRVLQRSARLSFRDSPGWCSPPPTYPPCVARSLYSFLSLFFSFRAIMEDRGFCSAFFQCLAFITAQTLTVRQEVSFLLVTLEARRWRGGMTQRWGREGGENHAQHGSLRIASPCRLTPSVTNSKRAELPDTPCCLRPIGTSPLLIRRVRDLSFRLPICCTLAVPDPAHPSVPTQFHSLITLHRPSTLPPSSPPSLSKM